MAHFGLIHWEIYLIISTLVGVFFISRTKNISTLEKFLWKFALLIFNFLVIIAFFIWRKSAKKL